MCSIPRFSRRKWFWRNTTLLRVRDIDLIVSNLILEGTPESESIASPAYVPIGDDIGVFLSGTETRRFTAMKADVEDDNAIDIQPDSKKRPHFPTDPDTGYFVATKKTSPRQMSTRTSTPDIIRKEMSRLVRDSLRTSPPTMSPATFPPLPPNTSSGERDVPYTDKYTIDQLSNIAVYRRANQVLLNLRIFSISAFRHRRELNEFFL